MSCVHGVQMDTTSKRQKHTLPNGKLPSLYCLSNLFKIITDFFYLSIVDTKCYISFRWYTIVLPQVCIMRPSVTVQCCYSIIDYIPHAVPFIPVTYSFHNWKPVSPTPLHLFCPSPHPCPSGNHSFVLCIYRLDSAFCFFVYSLGF